MLTPDSKYEIKSLQLNSKDRSSGEVYNPSYVLGESLKISGVKVKSALIGFSVYPISARNQKIYFVEQATPSTVRTATLTAGYYTGSSIATELKTRLDAAGTQTYTVTYSSTTNMLTISASANFAFTTNSAEDHGLYELGLLSATSQNTSHTSTQIDISGVKQLNVVSNIGAIQHFNSNKKLLCSIPVEEQNLSVSLHIDDSSDYVNSSQEFSEISLTLFDERTRAITSITQDWSLTLNFLTE